MSASGSSSSKAGGAGGGNDGSSRQDEGLGSSEDGMPSMSMSSDEINYLIFRYMQECGYVHSAFTFVYESMLGRSNIRNAEKSIPPGALVNFLQKGLQFVGIEERLHQETAKSKKASSNQDLAGVSLLSSQTIGALTREIPPIQLNVPPASAAAAVRARLEIEAKQEAQRKAAAIKAAKESQAAKANGRKQSSGPSGLPQQAPMNDSASTAVIIAQHQRQPQQALHQTSSQALAVQAATKGVNPLHPSDDLVRQAPAESAGAAAFVAQQRRVVAREMAAMQEQQQQLELKQQQLAEQQQKLHEAKRIGRPRGGGGPAASSGGSGGTGVTPMDTTSASTLPLTPTKSSQQQSGSKRALSTSSKKGQKGKGKSAKQKTSAGAAAATSTVSKNDTQSKTALHDRGLASLTEAAVQSEAAGAKKSSTATASTQQSKSSSTNSKSKGPAATGGGTKTSAAAAIGGGGASAMDVDEIDTEKVLSMPAHEKGANAVPPNDTKENPLNGASKEVNGKNGSNERVGGKKQHKHRTSNGEKAHPVTTPVPSSSSAATVPAVQMTPTPSTTISADGVQKNGQSGSNLITTLTSTNTVQRHLGDTNVLLQPRTEVLDLKMHSSEVFMCAWNPIFTDIIATGSGDASARIWKMGGPLASDGLGPVILLPHGAGPKDKKNKDVTTLEWSSDGKLLATGSYDGVARVWSQSGALVHTLRGHKGPIFSLKWNKRGNFLLSGSYDKTTIVWDVSTSTGFIQQQFNDHKQPALDVDWKDDMTFASCSTDKTVHICQVGTQRPLKIFTGHTDEVNAVKWDPSGMLLASCSDDCTAKVWEVTSNKTEPLHDFKSHEQEIYTVKWSPTGPGSANPGKQPMLATASFDGSVRLWNVRDGSCFRVFSKHSDSVYSVAFSPSGDFLASGSLAGQLFIWNVQLGIHIKSFKGEGDIFEVAWNKEETRVAACFSSNVVSIIDFTRSDRT